jgi:GGDEF domain-containing protein
METFGLVGELEIRKAMRLQYPVAILAITADRSPDGDGRQYIERVARLVTPLVRQTDLVSVSGKTSPALYVLLVDALPGDLDVIMARIGNEVHRHHVSGRTGSELIRINLGAACFPSTATTWRQLVSEADRAARADAD